MFRSDHIPLNAVEGNMGPTDAVCWGDVELRNVYTDDAFSSPRFPKGRCELSIGQFESMYPTVVSASLKIRQRELDQIVWGGVYVITANTSRRC
jgi:hypothetical protein